jgi:hypothetical protein
MLSRRASLALPVLFICICLVLQFLGAPVGLIDLLAFDSAEKSSLSEGFSIPPATPKIDISCDARYFNEAPPIPYCKLFAESIFHPPSLS